LPLSTKVPVLWLGTAERISAIAEMNHPGVWIFGDLDTNDRLHGMGIVVAYAGRTGHAQWIAPPVQRLLLQANFVAFTVYSCVPFIAGIGSGVVTKATHSRAQLAAIYTHSDDRFDVLQTHA
jgi:hypothetical protein